VRIDLHVHSDVSDGTDTPADLVALARQAGLDAIALTDHDTFEGWAEAAAAGEHHGVAVLPGIELSAHSPAPGEVRGEAVTDRRSVHVLGYGVDPVNEALTRELGLIRQGREDRIPKMIAALGKLGLVITLEEVQAQCGEGVIGRPHVADALVARGYAAHRDEVFARWLSNDGPVQVRRYTPEVARAVDLIVAAGGVAVLAHPWARGGEAWLPVSRIEELVKDHGLGGLEADHLNHSDAQRAELRALADRLGVLVTGSSDYHGTGKRNFPLGAWTTDEGVYREITARACNLHPRD
jgi:predicted metal-dependent phosphoesterase TrpH